MFVLYQFYFFYSLYLNLFIFPYKLSPRFSFRNIPIRTIVLFFKVFFDSVKIDFRYIPSIFDIFIFERQLQPTIFLFINVFPFIFHIIVC